MHVDAELLLTVILCTLPAHSSPCFVDATPGEGIACHHLQFSILTKEASNERSQANRSRIDRPDRARSPTLASANYLESEDGDLSGAFQSPTPITLVPNGSTNVSGTIEGAGMGTSVDLDYFTVTVPMGQVLSAFNVLAGTQGAGGMGSFIAIFSGSTAIDPGTASSADTLGYYLYGAADIGNNILPAMGTFNFQGTNSSIGFTPPLPAADYTFWIQEGFNGTFPYNFALVLSPVPEPSTAVLMGLAGLVVGLRRYRRKK